MKQFSVLLICGLVGTAALATVTNCWAAPQIVAGITNVAAAANGGLIVAYSSQVLDENGQIMPEWQVTHLIDGKCVLGNYIPSDSYGWSSQNVPSLEAPEWVVFTFAGNATKLIGRIVIDPTTPDPLFIGRWVRNIRVEVSTTSPDGPYQTVGRFLVVNKPLKQAFDFPATEAKYVRLVITSNHGSDKCVEMGEVEIYEAITPTDTLDQLIIRLENLLQDLKKYRDVQLYQQHQEALKEVTTKPAPPASESPPAASTVGEG